VGEYSPAVSVIASVYADAYRVGAFPPLDLPAVAAEAGAQGGLPDTALKAGENLFTHLEDGQLVRSVEQCKQFHFISALASSLTATEIARAS
jgi:hypothetical protein